MFKARLAKTYGWTDAVINEMSYSAALDYYNAVTVLDAEDRLMDFQVAAYPHLQKNARSKLHRTVSKAARPKELQREVSFEELYERMKNGG